MDYTLKRIYDELNESKSLTRLPTRKLIRTLFKSKSFEIEATHNFKVQS